MDTENKGNNLTKYLRLLHYSSKLEMLLKDFFVSVKLTVVIDIAIWLLTVMLFFASDSKIAFTWFHSVHMIRGVFGYFVVGMLPRSETVINKLKKELVDTPQEKFMPLVKKVAVDMFVASFRGSSSYSYYFLCNMLCYGLDVIGLIYIVDMLQDTDPEESGIYKYELEYLMYLFAVLAYCVADMLYFLWVSSLSFHFPVKLKQIFEDMSVGVSKSFKGFLETVKKDGNNMRNSIQDMRNRASEGEKRYDQADNQKDQGPRLFDKKESAAIEVEIPEEQPQEKPEEKVEEEI